MAIENILSSAGTKRLNDNDRLRLSQWNQFLPRTIYQCVHHMIHERSLAQPEAIATCAWDGSWSYRELDELSTIIARILVEQYEIQAETFVPICMEKSRWAPVAMLAVMKAGGAFVLVDPSHPPQRLKQISDQVAAPLALVSAACVSLAPSFVSKWLVIEEVLSLSDKKDYQLPNVAVSPDSALYAAFTSGSTGNPKGVVATHSGWASCASHSSASLRLSPQSRVLQFVSYAFDVSIADHLLTLLNGGCICIPSPTERDLSTAINDMNVNWAFLTPSVARTIRPARVPGLQHLVLGGEAVTQTDLDLWGPTSTNLLNLYGPSEHAICITVHDTSDPTINPRCLGKSSTATCWVVDPGDHHQLVPLGEDGELVVEGPTVTRGYINDPVQTAAAVIQDPKWLSRRHGTRKIYKTGDLVRYTSDGNLEYRGRKDNMVKVRGQRVELGEVEHHIIKCFPEAEAVVAEIVPVGETGSSTQLVAFICSPNLAKDTAQISTEQLLLYPASEEFQEHSLNILSTLEKRVPSYMVPSAILQLSCLPFTKTGKADRRLLREQARQSFQMQRKVEKPISNSVVMTTKEKVLQCLWAEVLDLSLESIGRDDDWLSLRGDSLLAMKLVSRARDDGIVLTVQDVFHHSRLSDLATKVREVPRDFQEVPPPFSMLPNDPDVGQSIIHAATKQSGPQFEDIYPCLEFQSHFCRASIAKESNFTSELEIGLPPGVSEEKLANAWKAVVQAHPMLRTHFVWLQAEGPFWQVVMKEGTPMEIITSGQGPSHRQDLWGFNQPLVRLYKQQDKLRLLMHHTVWDDHSISAILKHLGRAYEGHKLTLRPVSPLINWSLQPDDAGKEFWRRSLEDLQAPKFPAFPSKDFKPETTTITNPYQVRIRKGSGAFTVDSRLRLALAVVIAKITNASNVVFGAAVSRRAIPIAGAMDMVATLTSIRPVPVRLDRSLTLREALETVQNHALEAGNYPEVGVSLFHGLGPEIAEIAMDCLSRTFMEIQPAASSVAPSIFSRCKLHDNQINNIALLLEGDYRDDCTNFVAKYDERVISTLQVNQLLEQFAYVAELTENRLDTSLGSILSS